VHSGHESHRVIIRFDPQVADYIREKKWHPSQEVTALGDGGVELRLRLSSLGEIQRWILSWAGGAVPIAPPELVESIRSAAKALLSKVG
jgi:predicted DNA-binding transcriptional regulator YafY